MFLQDISPAICVQTGLEIPQKEEWRILSKLTRHTQIGQEQSLLRLFHLLIFLNLTLICMYHHLTAARYKILFFLPYMDTLGKDLVISCWILFYIDVTIYLHKVILSEPCLKIAHQIELIIPKDRREKRWEENKMK